MTPASPAVRAVVREHGLPMDAGARLSLLQMLLERGVPVTRAGAMPTSATDGGVTLVLDRFDGSAPPDERATRFADLDRVDAAGLAALVDDIRSTTGADAQGAWKPWFPVIDYGRCTNCMQCLSFCLFDVYGVSADGKIQVQKESNCKTECPACSRVCPEVAIMFPKYRHGPINGDEVSSDDVRREAMKVDISALLGGDIYQALRDRSAKAKSRFSKERDDDRALRERANCLVKLQQALDIPPEVLAALPSVDDIRTKAAAATARAAAAAPRDEA
jgi:Pyruvate/2-oxoacid:ferredoxin oxidoreductase delta subunit